MYKVIWRNLSKEFANLDKARKFMAQFPKATIIKDGIDLYVIDFDILYQTL
jgi:hypothetical protein